MTTQSSDGTLYNNQADYETGYDAIIAFHNKSVTSYKENYHFTLVGLVKELSARRNQKFFIEGLGLAIQNADMSKSRAKSAMEVLAIKGKGRIPATNGAFYTALVDEAATPNWIDGSAFVLVESAKNVVTGVSHVGDAVINTGAGILSSAESISKNLAWIVPLITIGGAILYINNTSKKA